MANESQSMPNLECRMYRSHYPKVDSIVMVKLIAIDDEGVSVSLLEYNNKPGRILFSMGTSSSPNVIGRIEPLRVCARDKKDKSIILNRDLSFDEKNECERAFNKAKYVQSVLCSVAEDFNMNLKDLYKTTQWPSYEDLHTLGEADWFKPCALRTALLERIKLMEYFSWRIVDPSILQLCILVQVFGLCWAISIVRQMEAYLKLYGFLDKHKSLCPQDLINKAPPDAYDKAGELTELEELREVLEEVGLVVAPTIVADNTPTNFALDQQPVNTGRRYKVDRMRVFSEGGDGDDDRDVLPEGYLDIQCIDDLRTLSPVAASVIWFPSYNGIRDDVIFKPTDAEYEKFKEDGGVNLPVHVMLLSGHGTDRHGIRYLEFEDCGGGDVGNGDRGYIRFARDPNPIIEYVRVQIFRKPKRKKRGQ